MHRRRLMHPTDDRLEVGDVERPRIEISIPADDVEWMMVQHELVDAVVLLHQKREVAALVVRVEHQGASNVALRVRRALLQLAELVAITLRPTDVTSTLHYEQLRRAHG